MENAAHTAQPLELRSDVAYVGANQLDVEAREILDAPKRQVVEDDRAMSFLDEAGDQMATDEPGTTRHEHVHCRSSWTRPARLTRTRRGATSLPCRANAGRNAYRRRSNARST